MSDTIKIILAILAIIVFVVVFNNLGLSGGFENAAGFAGAVIAVIVIYLVYINSKYKRKGNQKDS